MKIKEFNIDEQYLTSVMEVKPIVLEYEGEIMEGTSTGYIDHPEFTKLRNELEKLGYIQVQRSWWNGDTVLKRFKLNGFLFPKGEKFACASALANSFSVKRKHNYGQR